MSTTAQPQVTARFPPKLRCLFQPSRYKIIYGGRGGGKSWAIARALLLMGYQRPLRVLCAREFQASISDSVHKLLSDQIFELGLGDFYTVEKATIYGANGTEFRFAGIRTNIGAIKSFEGIDLAWVEEAVNVSRTSWMTLIPTIRKDDSEIWISFNPELESDETYQRFVVAPPADSIVTRIGWQDNPWFPETLKREKDDLEQRSVDDYLHVYGGECKHALDGAVFAKELRDASTNGRICSVPYIQSRPVETFWDLGKRDMTSIWFAQTIGHEFHIIDFYERCGEHISHFIKYLQEKPYAYATHWLPHDADHDLLASKRTIKQQMQAVFSSVRTIEVTKKATQIEAGRSVFGQCWFDQAKTADGIQHLRHYQFEIDPETHQRSKEPLHDEHSHAADAYMTLAMSMREPNVKPAAFKPVAPRVHGRQVAGAGWMR
jgi:phage terminase large subunit